MAAMNPQVVQYQGEPYFVCDYTGALIKERFFIPSGNDNKAKEGSFVTLPVALRWLQDSGKTPAEFAEAKDKLLQHFDQPDIPMQPPLDRFPVDRTMTLAEYLNNLPQGMGSSWLLVNGSEKASDYAPEKKKPKKDHLGLQKPKKMGKGANAKSVYRLQRGLYVVDNENITGYDLTTQLFRLLTNVKDAFNSTIPHVWATGSFNFKELNPFSRAWKLAPYGGAFVIVVEKQVELPVPDSMQVIKLK